jgi:hypothetical protein
MPRGTASRWTTRYAVRLTVPRRGGWRAWGTVRADFERALADAVDPAIASAEIASELPRGVDYVRVTIAVTVVTTDVADALAIAWDAFRSAARDDVTGWEVAAATAQVQPEPPLTEASDHTERRSGTLACGPRPDPPMPAGTALSTRARRPRRPGRTAPEAADPGELLRQPAGSGRSGTPRWDRR